MASILIKSPDGEEVELVSSSDEQIIEGAMLGAQALLNLLCDELELDDGYEIIQSTRDPKPFMEEESELRQ